LTTQPEIGVDVEKITLDFKEAIAKKFFHPNEYATLMDLPPELRAKKFYYYWARKEALQKSIGNGLFKNIENTHDQYHIENFFIHEDFEAAFAVTSPIHTILHWQWSNEGYMPLN
jgi:phosphopantetheine--protein transferase-like protein